MSIAVQKVELTQEQAAFYLNGAGVNRPIANAAVSAYRDEMDNGEWDFDEPYAGTIVLNSTGQLIDGQHRLSAFVGSKLKTFSAVVLKTPHQYLGDKPDVKVRKMSHKFAMVFGLEKDAASVAAVTNAIYEHSTRKREFIDSLERRESGKGLLATATQARFTALKPIFEANRNEILFAIDNVKQIKRSLALVSPQTAAWLLFTAAKQDVSGALGLRNKMETLLVTGRDGLKKDDILFRARKKMEQHYALMQRERTAGVGGEGHRAWVAFEAVVEGRRFA